MATEQTSKVHEKPLNKNHSKSTTMPATTVSSNYPYGISFTSNIAFANERDDIAYIEKRTAHNALERQRREGLNSKFQELAHVLPALQQIRRPSKSMIVAKSLEFVSNANERESDFQGQLQALRKENEQLMRQASLSKKRMKRRLEQDKPKKPLLNETSTKTTLNEESTKTTIHEEPAKSSINEEPSKSTMAMTLRKRPSKLKSQSRKLESEELPLSPTKSIGESSQASIVETKPSKKRSMNELEPIPSKQLPQKRERSDSHSTIQSSSSIVADASSSASNSKRRKRNVTTETYQQAPPSLTSTPSYTYFNTPTQTIYPATVSHYDQYQQPFNHHHQHHRYNSHQSMHHQQQDIISPEVSRHNSLTMADLNNFNQTTDSLVVPSQFGIDSSPFVEQMYYNAFEPFDQPLNSSIPVVRTPIGDRNSMINTPSPASQPYDATLDLINAIITPDQGSSDTNPFYGWR